MKPFRKFMRRYLKHYLLLLPFFALFITFYLWPIIYSAAISMTKWDGIHAPVFVGLQNYTKIFATPRFSTSMLNLARFVAVVVPVGVTLSLALALLVDQFTRRWSSFFRSIYFFPVIIPLFLAGAIWRYLLSPQIGILNLLLAQIGITGIGWLREPVYMVLAVAMVDMWRAIGFNFLLLLTGIKGIPHDYYEAARVDGANRFQQMIYITIPQLEPVLFLVTVNAFIGALQTFDIPWLLSISKHGNYGGNRNGMLFPVMEIYESAWGRQAFGDASAYAVILLGITLAITVIQFVWRRWRLAE